MNPIHKVNVDIALRYLNRDMDACEKFEFEEEMMNTPYMQKAIADAHDEFFLLLHNFDLPNYGPRNSDGLEKENK
ncbi:MAG: hypothetical protein AAF849_07580 [Bacteroidota bacterium]